jgi:cysteine desulfurase
MLQGDRIMNRETYMDHAATTAMRPEVLDAMLPYLRENYGNPSSVYSKGTSNKEAVEKSRKIIANTINATPDEIYFTAGGSESDNWSIKGIADSLREKGRHIITSKIEHHAVLNTCEFLEKRGFFVTYLDVDENGVVSPERLLRAIRPDTILISIMFANNEIGTIQPIRKLAEIARSFNILFHTDAVQAYGQLPIDVKELRIDLMSASGHKLYGPKGTGFLYIREGIKITNLIHGGKQETGLRSGTENVPGIVGLGKASELAIAELNEKMYKECRLRDYLIERVLSEISFSRLNGHRRHRLPNNTNFSFQFIEGEALLVMLDMQGISASGGSACTAGSAEPSHVLRAIGLPKKLANASLRLTIGTENTVEDVDYVVESLKEIVENLRNASTEYADYIKRFH